MTVRICPDKDAACEEFPIALRCQNCPAKGEAMKHDPVQLLSELREYAEKNRGTWILPGWDSDSVAYVLSKLAETSEPVGTYIKGTQFARDGFWLEWSDDLPEGEHKLYLRPQSPQLLEAAKDAQDAIAHTLNCGDWAEDDSLRIALEKLGKAIEANRGMG
jgi:hypothetical protein